MRLGAALAVTADDGGPQTARGFARSAARIEALGFSSIWVFDAVARGFILPDPLMALAIAAALTSRVELGTGILQLSNRNTVDLAYRALTLHHVAEGRLLLGVAPGSTKDDFDAFGEDYPDRFRRFERELPRFRRLLSTGRDGETDLTPWPSALGGPRVLFGAWRGPWVHRAATEADGWIASAAHNTDEVLADAIVRFRASGGTRAIVTNVQIGRDIEPALLRLAHLRTLGFDDAVVQISRPTEERLRTIRQGVA